MSECLKKAAADSSEHELQARGDESLAAKEMLGQKVPNILLNNLSAIGRRSVADINSVQ